MERRLAAILAADVVGYSRLVERDEAGAFERLRAHRRELFEPEIDRHHGRIFKLMGDGLLAEFGSVVDAVECAISLQRGMSERNQGLADGERIDVRIGINLGDVIVEGDDRHGEGVVIAARLQQLAEPGGIAVARTVADHVKHKLDARFESLGSHSVKNIAEPVGVCRIIPDRKARQARSFAVSGRRRRNVLAAAIVLLIVGGALEWLYMGPTSPPGPPGVAVLPFANMSGDPSLDYFSDGATEDIITALASFPEILVVARTSSFAYKGQETDVRQIAGDLGVRYVLEGSVRKLGNKARITAQLINGASGEHVWANSFDEEGDDIVALQDAVAAKVYASVAGFQGEIRHAEEQTAWTKSAMDLEEYDYYLRGHALFFHYTKEDMAKARAIWEEGLAKFPDSALLRVKIAWSLRQDMLWGWSDDPKRDLDRCWKLGLEAVAVENKSRLEQWYTHWLMAWLYQYHEADFGRSVAEAQAAVQVVPFDAFSRGDMAEFMANAGRTEEAIDWAQQAIRHDPKGPDWYRINLVWAYYLAGRYEDVLTERKKVTSHECCRLMRAASLVHLGRMDEARAAVVEFLQDNPGDTIEAEAISPLKEPWKQAWLDDLRKAGMPEK